MNDPAPTRHPGSRCLQALRVLRSHLESGGRGDWLIADATEIYDVSAEAVHAYAASLPEKPRVFSIDSDTGAAGPVLYVYDLGERRTSAARIVYDFDDQVLFLFKLEDQDLSRPAYMLVAAPSADRLGAVLDRMAEFVLGYGRGSDACYVIGNHRIPIDRSLSWDDLFLPDALKQDVRANVERFLSGRAAYDRLSLPYKRGFLFVGPPGNGKTLLCRTIVARSGLPCVTMLCADGSRDELGEAFRKAACLAPCILIFEDIDSLFELPGKTSYFLNLMDGFRTNEGVLTLATTNHPEEIDAAVLRRPSRFDRVWLIDHPDAVCRRTYLSRLFEGYLAPGHLEELARRTDEFSMAYLKELYLSSAHRAAQEGREIELDLVLCVLETLRRQMRAASDAYDVQTIGFAPPDEE